jgi:hypothetical protein
VGLNFKKKKNTAEKGSGVECKIGWRTVKLIENQLAAVGPWFFACERARCRVSDVMRQDANRQLRITLHYKEKEEEQKRQNVVTCWE